MQFLANEITHIHNQNHGSDPSKEIEPRRNPNPNLGKGPKWLFITTCGTLEKGFVKSEGKDGLLMHAFSYCAFPLLSLFLSSFFLFLSLFSYCYLAILSPLSMAAALLYSGLISWDFSLLPLGFTNYFWFIMGIPSRLPINSLVAWPLPPLGKPSVFSLFP